MEIKKNFLLNRRLRALKTFFFSKKLRKEGLKVIIKHLYTTELLKKSSISSLDLQDITQQKECKVVPFTKIDGNISYYELIALSSLIQEFKPTILLEIGTFNGLSTLHMAINSPESAKIHTLDLLEIDSLDLYVDVEDIKYIKSSEKFKKKYGNHPEKEKIIEHYGNSLLFPFDSFGNPDFIFIDGGHSYAMVKNDTEKSLAILKKGGVLLWHDYTPDCPGVFNYLSELRAYHPIFHIKETSLACLVFN